MIFYIPYSYLSHVLHVLICWECILHVRLCQNTPVRDAGLAFAIALYNNSLFPSQMTPNSSFTTMEMVSRLMALCFLQSWLLIVHDKWDHTEICRIKPPYVCFYDSLIIL